MHQSWNTVSSEYCSEFSSAEPGYLKELVAFTWKQTINPRMLSGHLQGRVLSMLSSLTRPVRALEIGTFTGYSALCLAEGLDNDGKLITVEANGEYAHKAKAFIEKTPLAYKIEVVHAQGLDYIAQIESESVDLVFVDADKAGYKNYYETLKPKLKSGGLMIFDNVLWSGKVMDEAEVHSDKDTRLMHEFNGFMAAQPGFEVLILPMRDGLGIYRKK